MKQDDYRFPFGEPLKRVQQKDRSPKKVFVLGVYASAVHARWVDKDGKQKVAALAVASEPCIFWKGENAEEIITAININIPESLGKLTLPSNKEYNGPSGNTLDNKYLAPLGVDRKDTWLCDLLPESRVNRSQRVAISKHYTKELIKKYNLSAATVPDFRKDELNSEIRRAEILQELEISQAETIILLGDEPINWFLRFHDPRYSKLSQFGEDDSTYGKPKEIKINGRFYQVIALCHPRQSGRLGTSSQKWGLLHDKWIKQAGI